MAKCTLQVPRNVLSDLSARMVWARGVVLSQATDPNAEVGAAMLADGITKINRLMGMSDAAITCLLHTTGQRRLGA